MKPIIQWLRVLGVLATFLFVVACGNSPQQDAAPASSVMPDENFYIGKDDVYAYLDSASGGSWVFTKITDSDMPPAKGYLVRLNDLAPAFDTRVAECAAQNYPTDHKCSPSHPFRNKDVGVIGKLISGGLAAGTGGKVTDVSRTYETSFDETAFNQAVDEALTNTGLDSHRQELFAALETYAENLAVSRSTLSVLESEMNAKYQDTATVQLDIQPNITGLTEYFSNDIDLRGVIELLPRTNRSVARPAVEEKKLLPCDARLCLQNTRDAITSLRTDFENINTRLARDAASGQGIYDVRCDKTSQSGYLFTLSCPAEIKSTGSQPVPLALSLHILARDFDSLYPDMDIADEALRIAIAGQKVTFENLTPVYLSIGAQTVYFNSQVETNSSEINIAPGATVSRPISDFVSPAIDIEASFQNMTPDKAKNTSFQFGFAANYSVAGETSDTTLHELRTFNVACAIRNRVKPGSCRETGIGDAVKRPVTY